MNSFRFVSRLATPEDAFPIMKLYADAYQGKYTDPLMASYELLKAFLSHKNNFWFIAEYNKEVIASVVLRYDPSHRISKAYGAVVHTDYRKNKVMESLLAFGIDFVQYQTPGVDVLYATTRTVHEAAQALTDRLGFKKLGIFPNAHKAAEFETHCLTALFSKSSWDKRYLDYKLHPELKRIVEIIHEELKELTPMETIAIEPSTKFLKAAPTLELIQSEHFVKYRFEELKSEKALQFAFFPFHEPNVLILSPDQSTELFCYLSKTDGYSVIIGGKVGDDVNFTDLFNSVSLLLRDHQARYIEALIRADKPKIIESIINAKFIPSAFFPAFQLHNNKRYDYVVMSKTFEIFDFQNLKLTGLNQKFLEEYFRQWKHTSLNPMLIKG